jgi:hypothetical protein
MKVRACCEKRKKNARRYKVIIILFKEISVNFNTCIESFKSFENSQQRPSEEQHSVRPSRSLNIFSILHRLSFECSCHVRKESASKETGIVSRSVDEA